MSLPNRPAGDVTGSPEFSKYFNNLSDNDPFKMELRDAFNILKEDCTRGEKIQHNIWPEIYVNRYGINNLWRFELREGARLVYTILGGSGGLIVSILEVFSTHQEYDQRFGF